MKTISQDIRDFPADVQDLLRDRAVRERKPVEEIIAGYVLEVARMIVAAAGQDEKGRAA